MSRARRRLTVAVCLAALIPACRAADTEPGTPTVPAALTPVAGTGQQGVAGLPLHDSIGVRVTDASGRPLPGATVRFATADGGRLAPTVARTDADGVARAAWTLGAADGVQTATATTEGVPTAALSASATRVSATVLAMLRTLDAQIATSAQSIRDLLPRNPQFATYAEAKLAMLRVPTLARDIVRDRRWVEDSVTSSAGQRVSVVAVFPLDSLRGEATQSVRTVTAGLPVLERFTGAPFPAADVRVWEGFVLGNSGGGGALFMEDRATYEARTTDARLPFDAILLHESAHSYVSNESLTQFLELYAYNVPRTGTTDPRAWVHTRGWQPAQDANEGVHALLDVYELLGHDAMSRAYRAVVEQRPLYGQPLPPALRQAFVDEAPAAAKAVVAAKMARITS